MFDIESWLIAFGLPLIAFIVFAESGLLFGFFFPGDTLLLAAGILAAQGHFGIVPLITIIVISAILGGNVGYSIGRRAGPRLFRKEDGILFRHEYVTRAEEFYEKHGGKTIIIARFVPIVRTFAPVVAGIGKMDRKRFFIYNVLGSGIWGIGVTLLGYYFGSKIPHLDEYIHYVLGAVIVLSFGPALYHVLKDQNAREKLLKKIKSILSLFSLNKR